VLTQEPKPRRNGLPVTRLSPLRVRFLGYLTFVSEGALRSLGHPRCHDLVNRARLLHLFQPFNQVLH
jgi:hypothetical protein